MLPLVELGANTLGSLLPQVQPVDDQARIAVADWSRQIRSEPI